MTDNNHPITPPPELVQKWLGEYFGCEVSGELSGSERYIATQAARWGADQELEACINAILMHPGFENPELFVEVLRTARRPKPPSLKEQAQRILVENGTTLDGRMELDPDDIAIIRRALEALPD